MRIVLILLILIDYVPYIESQAYRCFLKSGIQYFSDDSTMHAIKLDSTVVVGKDTILYNYPTIRRNDFSCTTYKNNSWIGAKIIIQPTGYTYFITENNDSIAIKTDAKLHQTWIFFRQFRAYVAALDTFSFAGITDSVKHIRFQAVDSLGNPVTSLINNKELLLSKNYGLVELFEFYTFPDPVSKPFRFIGSQNPDFGNVHIASKDIFNYDVDDEFHIFHEIYSYPLEPKSQFDKIIQKVIEKHISGNGDTLTYKFASCKLITNINFGNYDTTTHWFLTQTPVYSLVKDTFYQRIIFPTLKLANSLPDQIIIQSSLYSYVIVENGYNGLFIKKLYGTYIKTNNDTCLGEVAIDKKKSATIDTFFDSNNSYIEGCGAYSCQTFMFNGDCSSLSYYKKKDKTWGIPFDCDSFKKLDVIRIPFENSLMVFPNPMKNIAIIKLPEITESQKKLCIFDLYGRLVIQRTFIGNRYELLRENLKSGIYLIVVSGNENLLNKSKLIVE